MIISIFVVLHITTLGIIKIRLLNYSYNLFDNHEILIITSKCTTHLKNIFTFVRRKHT